MLVFVLNRRESQNLSCMAPHIPMYLQKEAVEYNYAATIIFVRNSHNQCYNYNSHLHSRNVNVTKNYLIMLIFVPDSIFESLEEPLPTKIPIRYRGPPGPYKSRPRVSNMVLTAIKEQKKRNGSSLPAIKKYIAEKYKVDVVKLAPFIKKYIRSAVDQKILVPVKASYKISKKAKIK